MGQRHAHGRFLPPTKDPVPIVQEAGWAPRPIWTGAENLAPQRDSILGRSSPYPVTSTLTYTFLRIFSRV